MATATTTTVSPSPILTTTTASAGTTTLSSPFPANTTTLMDGGNTSTSTTLLPEGTTSTTATAPLLSTTTTAFASTTTSLLLPQAESAAANGGSLSFLFWLFAVLLFLGALVCLFFICCRGRTRSSIDNAAMYRSARSPPVQGQEIELHLHGDQDLLGDDVFDLRAYRDDARALEKSSAFDGGPMRSYSDNVVGEEMTAGRVGQGVEFGEGSRGGGAGGAGSLRQQRYSIGGDSVMAHEDEFL